MHSVAVPIKKLNLEFHVVNFEKFFFLLILDENESNFEGWCINTNKIENLIGWQNI